MSEREKHLEFIQAVVNRLAANSFAYKGWAITVTAGLVAFLSQGRAEFLPAAAYPIIAFWYLDSHQLALERAYRKLYDAAREGDIDIYAMGLAGYRRPLRDQIDAMLSAVGLVFYGSAAVFVAFAVRSFR